MTNTDFKLYLDRRLALVREHPEQYPADAERNITTMLKIVALGGQSARRVRRDYERNLAKRGVSIEQL